MASMRRARQPRANSPYNRVVRALTAGAAALVLFGANQASAQFAYGYAGTFRVPIEEDDAGPLPPRAVAYRLQDRGFSEITRPRFDGRAYVVDATNPAGRRVRLFVDAGDGAILGHRPLGPPPVRAARVAPGYGWTEADVAARRGDPEGLLPPADIPLPRPRLHTEVEGAPRLAARPEPGDAPGDANALGLNPDARTGARPTARGKAAKAAQRKTAKLTPPTRPAPPRTAPEAPVPPGPHVDEPAAAGASKADTAKPDTAKSDAAKPDSAKVPQATKVPQVAKAPEAVAVPDEAAKARGAPLLPAAKLPVEGKVDGKAATKDAATKDAENKDAASKDTANQWQDPPSGEAKRKVRVIGGISTVPGASASSGDAAPPTAD